MIDMAAGAGDADLEEEQVDKCADPDLASAKCAGSKHLNCQRRPRL